MKRKRFKEEQIIMILKEGEAGMATPELCRKHGISPGTYYRWKSKYGGMVVGRAARELVRLVEASAAPKPRKP